MGRKLGLVYDLLLQRPWEYAIRRMLHLDNLDEH